MFLSVLQIVKLNFAVAVSIAISSSIPSNMRWTSLSLKMAFSGGRGFIKSSILRIFFRKNLSASDFKAPCTYFFIFQSKSSGLNSLSTDDYYLSLPNSPCKHSPFGTLLMNALLKSQFLTRRTNINPLDRGIHEIISAEFEPYETTD